MKVVSRADWTERVRHTPRIRLLSNQAAHPNGFLGGMNWRLAGLNAVVTFCRQPDSHCADRDIYQFGVYSGLSMRAIVHHLVEAQVPFRRIWGFDSFSGLPHETASYTSRAGFEQGTWNISSTFGELSISDIHANLTAYISDTRVRWVTGFYNETLTDSLASRMSSALYVDMDCDLYSSAKSALDWMCMHGLLTNGSVIGYDDWFQGGRDGEMRAHREASDSFNISFKKVPNANKRWPSFRVESGCASARTVLF